MKHCFKNYIKNCQFKERFSENSLQSYHHVKSTKQQPIYQSCVMSSKGKNLSNKNMDKNLSNKHLDNSLLKKKSYAPIMLTSKSIQPFKQKKQQAILQVKQQPSSQLTSPTNILQVCKNKQNIQNKSYYYKANSSHNRNFYQRQNRMNQTEDGIGFKYYDQCWSPREAIGHNRKVLVHQDLFIQPQQPQYLEFATPRPNNQSTSIIRMQFNGNGKDKFQKYKRKNNNRYVLSSMGELHPDSKKITVSTNINISNIGNINNINISNVQSVKQSLHDKSPIHMLQSFNQSKPFEMTFSNFKQRTNQKIQQRIVLQQNKQSQWNQYLNQYYLNVRKVKTGLKAHVDKAKMRAKQKKYITTQVRNNRSQTNIQQKNVGLKFVQQNDLLSDKLHQYLKSTSKMQHSSSKSINKVAVIQSQIQTDMLIRRTSPQKAHFSFGLNDSSGLLAQSKSLQNQIKIKFQLYKDFLWKVNFSNAIYVRLNHDNEKQYKIFVGKGNNSSIIKGIMRRRHWWQLTDKISSDTNFVWTQLKINDFIKSQKKYISSAKDEQYSQYDQQSLNTFGQDIQQINQNVLQNTLLHKKVFKGKDLFLWSNHYSVHRRLQDGQSQSKGSKRLRGLVRKKPLLMINSPSEIRCHNHFQCNYYLGNKKALFYAMRGYYKSLGQDPFNNIPLTYHISGGLGDSQFQQFLQTYSELTKLKQVNKQFKNIWIIKPGEVTNRGNGITVCATLDQIKIRIKSKQKNSDGSLRTYILQKYIERPLLYNKRKFDIRHYMMMTCRKGIIKGYWYSQGYVRTTSNIYSTKNCKDLYTHLTNDAIQKNSAQYGKFQKGNKLSYGQFEKYLDKINSNNDPKGIFSNILSRMRQLAIDSMRATYNIIQPERRQHNFELFGLDFMLDESYNVNLIQVNTNPCLQLSCPLLGKIISGLIQNLFKICIDPLFPPPLDWPMNKKYQLSNIDPLIEQKFQLVFDQQSDAKALRKLNGTKFLQGKIGKIQEDQDQYADQENDQQWNQETDNISKDIKKEK